LFGSYGNIPVGQECGGISDKNILTQQWIPTDFFTFVPFSAFEIVGFEMITGTTPGALVIASK
jgi:hypothetical protein